jgi:mannose-6-phosphate isomerase-like protein (cupin superfamily)
MIKLDVYQEERPWGNFRQFSKNENVTVKIITVKPNQSLSLQSHQKRAEFWKIIKGNGLVEIDAQKKEAQEGDEFDIILGAKHRLTAGLNGIVVLEISRGEFDENDIYRFEDNYGRI